MVQISGTPLPVNPFQLGQIAVRSGSLPEGMLRPGSTLQMTVLQGAQAGQAAQVQIGQRTLQAVLPTTVAPGDILQVRVGRAADGKPEMMLAGQRTGAPVMQVPQRLSEAMQSAARPAGGSVLITVKDTPDGPRIQIGGRSYTPTELGVRPADLPRGSWPARLTATGGQLQLTPLSSETAQLRQAAGQLMVSGSPLGVQAAVALAEQAAEGSGIYTSEGTPSVSSELGIPWITLPGGQTAAIQMGPARLEDESSGSAHLELWGNQLGPVSIDISRSPAGIQIRVAADPQAAPVLQEGSRILSERLRQVTGMPSQVTVYEHTTRPLPPEGFEGYG